MSAPADSPNRKLAAELAIGLSVCAGLHFLMVDPVEAELAQVRQQIATTSSAVQPGAIQVPHDALKRTIAEVGAFARDVAARSQISQNQAALFSALMQEAEAAGVHLESMQPSAPRARQIKPRPIADTAPGSPPPPPPPSDTVTSYTLQLTGPYDAVCRFMLKAQGTGGFTLVRAGRVVPIYAPGSRNVEATIHTEHVAMDGRMLAGFNRAPAPETPR